jgi:hypothetical protein
MGLLQMSADKLFLNALKLSNYIRWGILLMYKKFLFPMLLTVALAGCGHQSSDKQGDQMDTALPVQDQITTPAPGNGIDQGQQPVNPSAEPTQPPPVTTEGTTQPAGTDTTTTTAPTPDTSTKTPTPPVTDNKDASTAGTAGTTK